MDERISLLTLLQFEMQEKRLHRYLSSYYEELRAMCLEKIYRRSSKNYHYQHVDTLVNQMNHYTDRSYGSVSSSPPPLTPRSPMPNQVYSRNDLPPMDMAIVNGTSMRGYMYKKSVKNDISIWRRRYFYLLTPEGRLMQYEDDQVRIWFGLFVSMCFTNLKVDLTFATHSG
jgi:hypothetical protein